MVVASPNACSSSRADPAGSPDLVCTRLSPICHGMVLNSSQVGSGITSVPRFERTGKSTVTFIHDEPPWLTTFTRIQEGKAASVLARYHSLTGDERDPLIMFEMAQIRHALKVEKEAAQSTSYTTLFATPGNRKRMMIIVALALFSQWRCVTTMVVNGAARLTDATHTHSGNGLVSYYINLVLEGVGISDPGTKAAINGGLQVRLSTGPYAVLLIRTHFGRYGTL